MRDEIRHLIEGFGEVANGNLIQAAHRYLGGSQGASGTTETAKFLDKKEEVTSLLGFAKENDIFFDAIDQSRYIGEGAEQKVYLLEDTRFVIKTNDAIFYEFWADYLLSLLMHNYLFPATAYELIGFYWDSEKLYSVVKQAFIKSDAPTNIDDVRRLLEKNVFRNTKNNDYANDTLGIILEDLHDENVLTSKGILFFIDTVIYLQVPK